MSLMTPLPLWERIYTRFWSMSSPFLLLIRKMFLSKVFSRAQMGSCSQPMYLRCLRVSCSQPMYLRCLRVSCSQATDEGRTIAAQYGLNLIAGLCRAVVELAVQKQSSLKVQPRGVTAYLQAAPHVDHEYKIWSR